MLGIKKSYHVNHFKCQIQLKWKKSTENIYVRNVFVF